MPVEFEGGDGCAVLIVEDSENSAAMLEMAFLGIPDVRVMQVPSAVEALRILDAAATPVRAVVTDLNMPRMDGFELIRRIRGDTRLRATPILVVSADTKVESPQKFPVRLTGVLLFNAFMKSKQSGGADYPVVAAAPGVRHSGATVRQTIIGLEFSGPPSIWGGRAHGSVYTDFFAGA